MRVTMIGSYTKKHFGHPERSEGSRGPSVAYTPSGRHFVSIFRGVYPERGRRVQNDRFWLIEIIGLVLLLGLLIFSFPAYSQTAPVFSLMTSPDLPFTGDRVTVSVLAENFTVASSTFAWFRNDQEILAASGLGKSSFSFLTDPTQSELIRIRVIVDPGQGFSTGEQTLTIYTLPNPQQQLETIRELQSDFSLEASEISPNPGEIVTVRVKTFAFDKPTAMFQWSVNGVSQREASGRGRFEFTLAAGKEGETKTVSVTVTPPSGDVRSKQITIRPATTAFYWWADTVTPYWYRGKALPSLNSRITVMALPPTGFSASDLSFRWEFNGSPMTQASGFGKNTFSFNFAFPVPESIGVTMQNFSGSFSKTADLDIEPRSPEIGIYEVKPLRGVVFERRLRDFSAASGDAYDFIALPFFFPKERLSSLGYLWTVNGQAIVGTFSKPWLLTLKPNAGEFSSSQVSVEVNDSVRGGERTLNSIRAEFR